MPSPVGIDFVREVVIDFIVVIGDKGPLSLLLFRGEVVCVVQIRVTQGSLPSVCLLPPIRLRFPPLNLIVHRLGWRV